MSVNKSHSEKAIMTMYVSALCFPAVSMIAGCSGTHSRDHVSSVLHGLVAGKESATGACGERWSRGGKPAPVKKSDSLRHTWLKKYFAGVQLMCCTL